MKKILFYSLILIIISCISVNASLQDAWDQQQGYWQMDANLTDFFGNSTNNMDDDGVPTGYTYDTGKINNAIKFDGSTGWTRGDAAYKPNEVGTIDLWLNRVSSSTSNLHHFNLVDGTSTRGFQITTASGQLRLVFTDTDCTSYAESDYGGVIWVNIILVNNSGGIKAYINGDKVLDDPTCEFATSAQDDIFLGRNYNVPSASQSYAKIDNLLITKYKYDSDDVNSSYNSSDGVNFDKYNDAVILENISIINSTWNMTSDGGCNNWTTNPRTTCDTTDGTPTVTFETNVNADCSLKKVAHNYTDAYKCSTTGSTSHICTLSSSLKLDYGVSNLHVACKDSGNNEINSSALPINMTAGGGGDGLVSCIKTIGDGCGISIENDCAIIFKS